MIYLDHAATTSVCPRAVAEMKNVWKFIMEIHRGHMNLHNSVRKK